MNIVEYLTLMIEANPTTKNNDLAGRLKDDYPEIPFKKSSLIIMLQTIKRGAGDTLQSVKEVDVEEFPIFSVEEISPVDLSNLEEEAAENAHVEIEEKKMKLEEKVSYTYAEGTYQLGDKVYLSGELISKLFVDYPSKGLNLSRTALINKYNLKSFGVDGHSVLRAVQSRLGLYKDSNIIPPHLYDELTPKELETYLEEQLDNVINNPEFIEKKYNNRILMKMRQTINQRSLDSAKMQDTIEELMETFKTINKTITLTTAKGSNGQSAVVTIADMHSGAKVKDVQRTHDFDTDVIRKRLTYIAKDLNECGFANVYIAIMGDVFQGSPYNHIGAGNTIEEQYASQYKVAYELLVEFIENVNNIAAIYAIGGNHDRASSDNRQDQKASMLDILMFSISKVIKTIPIEFHHDTLAFEVDNIVYILQHGHLNYHKKNSADIILDHGDANKFNMILRAHLHSLQVLSNDDRRNYRRVVVPSIYTGEDYSSAGGWSNNAGYTKFVNRQFYDDESKMLSPSMIVDSLA